MPVSDSDHHAAFLRYQPWRRRFEVGFWLVSAAINISGNAVVAVMDARRNGSGLPDWMPASWETSSGLVLLALVPALVWFTRRNPPSLPPLTGDPAPDGDLAHPGESQHTE